MEAELLHRDLALPAVVDERAHPHLAPFFFGLMAVADDRADQIVAVGEDVGFDEDTLALDPLRRKAAVVDLRRYAFDDDALATVKRLHVRLWDRHSCLSGTQTRVSAPHDAVRVPCRGSAELFREGAREHAEDAAGGAASEGGEAQQLLDGERAGGEERDDRAAADRAVNAGGGEDEKNRRDLR